MSIWLPLVNFLILFQTENKDKPGNQRKHLNKLLAVK